jgi:hypothetical protein
VGLPSRNLLVHPTLANGGYHALLVASFSPCQLQAPLYSTPRPPLHSIRSLRIKCQANRVWDRRRLPFWTSRLLGADDLDSREAPLRLCIVPSFPNPRFPFLIRHLRRTLQVEIPCLRPPETDGEEGYVSCGPGLHKICDKNISFPMKLFRTSQ